MDKKRSENITNCEKYVLVDLVLKYADTNENKKTDSVTNKQKEDAWNHIAEEHNSQFVSRTSQQLKQVCALVLLQSLFIFIYFDYCPV